MPLLCLYDQAISNIMTLPICKIPAKKEMLHCVLIVFLVFLVAFTGTSQAQGSGENTNCFCAYIYMPVCGVDGRTYGNACEAGCAGVKVVQRGKCREVTPPVSDCICARILRPVCGIDGRTYANACKARCAGVQIHHEGDCGNRPIR